MSGHRQELWTQVVLVVKSLSANAGDARDRGLIPGSGRSPGAGNGKPSPVFLPGKSYGWRSLAGYSPWGCKESDTTGHTRNSEQCLTWLLTKRYPLST